MQKQIRSALLGEGADITRTHYSKQIFFHFWGLVKLNINRLVRSFRKNGETGAAIQFSQQIHDPDGVVLDVTLARSRAFIADNNGNRIEFSKYLVPELRSSLLEVEGKSWRGE